MANPGDYVKITKDNKTYEGVLMPSKKEIKLDNGYNIGITPDNIKVLTPYEGKKKERKPLTKDKNLKNITILHCGGTVASKIDYSTGGVSAKFSPEEIIELFPELQNIANINSVLVAQMMSENMRFAHYNKIGDAINKEIEKGTDGIIITHGTDTLHYSSAALSFMLENPPIPIIIIGSQRSSDRGSSDAPLNMISAARIITETNFKGVAVCMHQDSNDKNCIILHPCKTRKMHTSRRDAFKSINRKPLGYVKDTVTIEESTTGKYHYTTFDPKLKIGLCKAHTNWYAEELAPYLSFDGLVIEGTGLGQLPNKQIDEFTKESENIKTMIKHLTEKIPVIMTSQCINGRVDMNVYSEGRRNMELGILGNNLDMTPETAFIKLSWLLSNNMDPSLISKNLRGEITERLEYEQRI